MATWKLVLVGSLFLTVEVSFFSSNVSKVEHGAWIPLCAGLAAAIVMVTWRRGREIVTENRTEEEGQLSDFLYHLRMADPAGAARAQGRHLPQPGQGDHAAGA